MVGTTLRRRLASLLQIGSIGGLVLIGVPAWAATETTVYSFEGGNDGSQPSGLLEVGGVLYGTTALGGASGNGTVFTITPAGVKRTIYSFQGSTDGAQPNGPLIEVGGTLYGTTFVGGAAGFGTVFSITPPGVEKVIYSFKGPKKYNGDGANPGSSLVYVNGQLYGTTLYGGDTAFCPKTGCGTVFGITPSGVETQYWSFTFSDNDGNYPGGGLTIYPPTAKNALLLLGTTIQGNYCFLCSAVAHPDVKITCTNGCGTLYTLNTSDGAYFQNAGVVASPVGNLVRQGSVLYGVTYAGGAANAGTVFGYNEANLVLHTYFSFSGGTDGAHPLAGLAYFNGAFYGTTYYGGSAKGLGTVFAITINAGSGSKKILHTFRGADGAHPNAALITTAGGLYGTTQAGGSTGNGTIYKIIP